MGKSVVKSETTRCEFVHIAHSFHRDGGQVGRHRMHGGLTGGPQHVRAQLIFGGKTAAPVDKASRPLIAGPNVLLSSSDAPRTRTLSFSVGSKSGLVLTADGSCSMAMRCTEMLPRSTQRDESNVDALLHVPEHYRQLPTVAR